jgi:5-methylcytosine-specific restriction endonuclease McrA
VAVLQVVEWGADQGQMSHCRNLDKKVVDVVNWSVVKNCANPNCNKEFTPHQFVPGQKYCCRKCRAAERIKNWQQANPRMVAKNNKKWKSANPSKVSEYSQAWYSANKERKAETGRTWAQANLDKVKEKYNRRRAIRADVTGDHYTILQFRDLCNRAGNVCLRCGEKKKLTADHVIPLSKGGPDSIDNIQPLCISCNDKKGIQTTDYRRKIE